LERHLKEEIETLASRIVVVGLSSQGKYSDKIAKLYDATQIANNVFGKALEELSHEADKARKDKS
jgi:hypothetical protein